MSVEIKKRVVLASVLKPVDDTRMLEKIGATLAADGYEVFIVGYPTPSEVRTPGIETLPLARFHRLSFKRLFIPWIVLKRIHQVKPELIIVNTPELLFVTVLNKLFTGRKIVYDVLENYYRTIRYTATYPLVIRIFLAGLVRLLEIGTSPFIDRFLLAEKGYVDELKFASHPVVLENKLPEKVFEHCKINHTGYHNLLFSGTLAPTTGVFDAIKLCKELHAIHPDYKLTVIGYAALPGVLAQIKKEIAATPYITLKGGDQLVPHNDILHEISKAGAGIIIYPRNPGTESSIPTKLYEYLALKLPILISHTPPSTDLVKKLHAGIVLQRGFTAATLHEQLAKSTFACTHDRELFWDTEGKKLLNALKF